MRSPSLSLDSPESLGASLLVATSPRRGVPPRDDPVRVLIVDDQSLIRQALTVLLRADPAWTIVGDVDSLPADLDGVTETGAQVVLINADHDGRACLRAIAALGALEHGPRVVVLGHTHPTAFVVELFRAGAFGYLPTTARVADLREAIAAAASGVPYVLPSTARALAAGLRESAPVPASDASHVRLAQLSDRERTVFRLVACGHSGPEIAERLGITVKTVDTYRHRINEKIGVHHRSEYVRMALDAGVLAPGLCASPL